jgi:CubicO group peptidase (beta-lactamase class C family)
MAGYHAVEMPTSIRFIRDQARDDDALPAPESLGLDPGALDALHARAEREAKRHEGVACQVAVARGGRLASFRSYGRARFADETRDARNDDLFSVFSVTKALVSSACWLLMQEGKLDPADRVADHIPEFAGRGKHDVTVGHLLTHTAGFPGAQLDALSWDDGDARLACMADWALEWTPGSRFVYHGSSSMWVVAELITRLSGMDYRDMMRSRIFEPLGLHDLLLGLPAGQCARVADLVAVGDAPGASSRGVSPVDAPSVRDEDLPHYNRPEFRAVGVPGGGAVASAAAIALFYQALLADAKGAGAGIWQPDTLATAWTVSQPGLMDPMTGQPAQRGLGVVMAGPEGRLWRGFAEGCSASSFGHMGLGGQIAWADPETGLSFAFVTNGADRDPARQGGRGFRLSTLAHACLKS